MGGLSLFCFKSEKVNIIRLFFLSLYGCIALSLMFSYIFSFTSLSTVFGEGAGGSYGFYLNEWLVNMVGPVAAGCLIGFLLLIWAILLNNKVVGFITCQV